MLKISDQAIQEFKNIINEMNTPEAGIRVYLKGGGCCSGPSIGLDLTQEPANPHSIHDYEGLRVFIEDAALETVGAATIEFSQLAENPGFRLKWEEGSKPGAGGCGCS